MIIDEKLLEEIKAYLNVYHSEDDILIKSLAEMAIEYILDYTGINEDEMFEKINSMKVALMLLVSDGYDNRGQTVPMYKQNLLLTSILNLHSKNLL